MALPSISRQRGWPERHACCEDCGVRVSWQQGFMLARVDVTACCFGLLRDQGLRTWRASVGQCCCLGYEEHRGGRERLGSPSISRGCHLLRRYRPACPGCTRFPALSNSSRRSRRSSGSRPGALRPPASALRVPLRRALASDTHSSIVQLPGPTADAISVVAAGSDCRTVPEWS